LGSLCCPFVDAGAHIGSSDTDGIHLDAPAHERLGVVLARQVRELLACAYAGVRWLPARSRSAWNSAAKAVSLVRRRTLNWPSARWPLCTMRRR
jgi:hypothetical protein